MIMDIQNLQQFYDLMFSTKSIREKIAGLYCKNQNIPPALTNSLKSALNALENIPKTDDKQILSLSNDKTILLNMGYEIEEIKKDIYFIEHSQKEFYLFLEKIHTDFFKQIQEGENLLKGIHFKNFITDRDGTINNYCGRYKSSIQSIYNSLFLTHFACQCADNSVILTSAPVKNIGLIDISINPKNIFIYAGSKGREYIDKHGIYNQMAIGEKEQNMLTLLNERLTSLVSRPEYAIFSLIGSGLQFKYGQTTISRQNIYSSISEEDSKNFLHVVKGIVDESDPQNKFFRIEDTGMDIEIILTLKNADTIKPLNTANLKAFDKGDGVQFLDSTLNLGIEKGPNLVCGDTKSDIPMVAVSMEKTKDTWSIFVTEDKELQKEVLDICPRSFYVSEPDILVSLLNNLSI